MGKLIPKAAVTRKCPELLFTKAGNLLGHLNCRFQMLIWVLLKKAHDGRFNFSTFTFLIYKMKISVRTTSQVVVRITPVEPLSA